MIKIPYPSKYVRKSLYQLITGLGYACFDSKVPAVDMPSNYVLLSTQNHDVNESVKCSYLWESEILLDIVTRHTSIGNTGNRVTVDDMTENIVNALSTKLILDNGLKVIKQDLTFNNDLTNTYNNQIVHRKLLRVKLLIN